MVLRKILQLLILLVGFLPILVNAMGLGPMSVHSHLNEPLNAYVKLVDVSRLPVEDINATLAPREAFESIGLNRPFLLTKIHFNVIRNEAGETYIHLTTHDSIKDPFLNILIDIWTSNGQLMRKYTILLDPPTFSTTDTATNSMKEIPRLVPVVPKPTPIVTPVPNGENQKLEKRGITPGQEPAKIEVLPLEPGPVIIPKSKPQTSNTAPKPAPKPVFKPEPKPVTIQPPPAMKKPQVKAPLPAPKPHLASTAKSEPMPASKPIPLKPIAKHKPTMKPL